jgi:hypothetical protein
MARSFSSAIASYNALVAAHGEQGAYDIIQQSLSGAGVGSTPEATYSGSEADQILEDVVTSAAAVRGARVAAQLATPATTQAPQNIDIWKSLFGI